MYEHEHRLLLYARLSDVNTYYLNKIIWNYQDMWLFNNFK